MVIETLIYGEVCPALKLRFFQKICHGISSLIIAPLTPLLYHVRIFFASVFPNKKSLVFQALREL
jgi:hypothetical protein